MKMTEMTECTIHVWGGDDNIVLDVKRGIERMWFEMDLDEAKAFLGTLQQAVTKAEGKQ